MQATRRRMIIDRHRGAEKARHEEARCEAAGRDDGQRTEGRDASEAPERIDDIDSLLKGVLAWLFGCRPNFRCISRAMLWRIDLSGRRRRQRRELFGCTRGETASVNSRSSQALHRSAVHDARGSR